MLKTRGWQAVSDKSNMHFKDLGLAEPLLRAVRDQGYENPTPIQQQAIPARSEEHTSELQSH